MKSLDNTTETSSHSPTKMEPSSRTLKTTSAAGSSRTRSPRSFRSSLRSRLGHRWAKNSSSSSRPQRTNCSTESWVSSTSRWKRLQLDQTWRRWSTIRRTGLFSRNSQWARRSKSSSSAISTTQLSNVSDSFWIKQPIRRSCLLQSRSQQEFRSSSFRSETWASTLTRMSSLHSSEQHRRKIKSKEASWIQSSASLGIASQTSWRLKQDKRRSLPCKWK